MAYGKNKLMDVRNMAKQAGHRNSYTQSTIRDANRHTRRGARQALSNYDARMEVDVEAVGIEFLNADEYTSDEVRKSIVKEHSYRNDFDGGSFDVENKRLQKSYKIDKGMGYTRALNRWAKKNVPTCYSGCADGTTCNVETMISMLGKASKLERIRYVLRLEFGPQDLYCWGRYSYKQPKPINNESALRAIIIEGLHGHFNELALGGSKVNLDGLHDCGTLMGRLSDDHATRVKQEAANARAHRAAMAKLQLSHTTFCVLANNYYPINTTNWTNRASAYIQKFLELGPDGMRQITHNTFNPYWTR
jgi:hypothetical protein